MHKTVRELESEKIQVTTDLRGQSLSIYNDIQTSRFIINTDLLLEE